MNTIKFYEHPRIIYLDANVDLLFKTQFINTCDAMIHARHDGETFGLSIGEFSIKNKPVITCPCSAFAHIDYLKNKALIYHDKHELMLILLNIKHILSTNNNWLTEYSTFTPENVMNIFNELLL